MAPEKLNQDFLKVYREKHPNESKSSVWFFGYDFISMEKKFQKCSVVLCFKFLIKIFIAFSFNWLDYLFYKMLRSNLELFKLKVKIIKINFEKQKNVTY